MAEILSELGPGLAAFDTSQTDPTVTGTRVDAVLPADLSRRLGSIDLKIAQRLEGKELEAFIRKKAIKQVGKQVDHINRFIGLDLEPKVEPLIEKFIEYNVNLIKSIVAETLAKARREIEKASNVGLRHEVLRDKLIHTLGLSKHRASLIARDQTLSLNAQVARETMKQAGVEEYIWTTSGDDRVRPSHRDLDGERFSWAKGPSSTGGQHPGEEIQCRCTPYPVVDFLSGDLSDIEQLRL